MPFLVPNVLRIINGPMGSTEAAGNNGAFNVRHKHVVLRCIASDGEGWEHVSVSLATRVPTWTEMCVIKGVFWAAEDVVVQYHPKRSEYVNCHPFVLHLWRPIGIELPTPPSYMVGPRSNE